MTGGTLSLKVVAVVMTLSVVSGFATGSVTYARFSDTEEASVTISAASDWDDSTTDVDDTDLRIKPNPVPRSAGTFTVDIPLDSNGSPSIATAQIRVLDSPQTVLYPTRTIVTTNETADNRTVLRLQFPSRLLFEYVDGQQSLDIEVTVTLSDGRTIVGGGELLLHTPEAGGAESGTTVQSNSSDPGNATGTRNGTANSTNETASSEVNLTQVRENASKPNATVWNSPANNSSLPLGNESVTSTTQNDTQNSSVNTTVDSTANTTNESVTNASTGNSTVATNNTTSTDTDGNLTVEEDETETRLTNSTDNTTTETSSNETTIESGTNETSTSNQTTTDETSTINSTTENETSTTENETSINETENETTASLSVPFEGAWIGVGSAVSPSIPVPQFLNLVPLSERPISSP